MANNVIHDINQINNAKFQLRSRLASLSVRQEMRKINRVTQPLTVHFLDGSVWWAQRQYPVPPQQATQDNTLFGFGVPGATATLGTEIEVNFPISANAVNTQGVFIRDEQANKIFVAHRGRVNRHGQWLSLNVAQFRSELAKAGCNLDVDKNGTEFIFIGEISVIQAVDIVQFVRSIDKAKSICAP